MRFLCLNFTHWQNHQHLFSKNIPIANFGHFWCQNGCNLGAFIRVKFGLKVLLRVKRLTFCNSGGRENLWEVGNQFAVFSRPWLSLYWREGGGGFTTLKKKKEICSLKNRSRIVSISSAVTGRPWYEPCCYYIIIRSISCAVVWLTSQ